MSINFLVPIVVAVLSMVIGFVWYSMQVFGKIWMRETGLSMDEVSKGPGLGYLYTTIASFVMGLVMAVFVKYLGTSTVLDGLATGFFAWFGFVLPAFVANYVFSRKSWTLLAVDAGYYMFNMAAAGAIAVLLK